MGNWGTSASHGTDQNYFIVFSWWMGQDGLGGGVVAPTHLHSYAWHLIRDGWAYVILRWGKGQKSPF